MSLTAALATASRALEVFSTAVQISSNNVANANTPGYIREELSLATEDPFKRGGVIVGAGVKATAVRQAIDQFLETRIHATNSERQTATARESIYVQLEGQLRELGDQDLSSRFSSFLAAINEVANQPEQGPLRNSIVSEGELLVSDISNLRTRVDQLRKDQAVRIDNLVDEANRLIDEIADLNLKITKQESNGLLASEAGGLRTQRYNALNRLSEIIPVQFKEQPTGSVDVYSGSEYVLFSGHRQNIETATIEDRGVDVEIVQFTQTHFQLPPNGGEIRGVIDGRDEILGAFITPVTLLFFVASGLGSNVASVSPEVRSALLPFHIGVNVLGVVAFALAFAGAVAYIIQERMLRQKQLGGISIFFMQDRWSPLFSNGMKPRLES